MCRVKDFTPKVEKVDYRIDRADRENSDQTLKDITAAHHECPRCGHLQLEASHCARCGIDIAAAIKQQRKEDLIIQKKIRDLKRKDNPTPSSPSAESGEQDLHCEAGAQHSDEPKKRGVMGWLRKSS